jgi:hypothetical protein
MLEVKVQATPEELEELRNFIFNEMGDSIDLQEIASAQPGELREPLLVAIIVALGGPAVVKGFVEVMNRWMEHREKIEELRSKHELLKLQLLLETESRDILLNDLMVLAEGSYK